MKRGDLLYCARFPNGRAKVCLHAKFLPVLIKILRHLTEEERLTLKVISTFLKSEVLDWLEMKNTSWAFASLDPDWGYNGTSFLKLLFSWLSHNDRPYPETVSHNKYINLLLSNILSQQWKQQLAHCFSSDLFPCSLLNMFSQISHSSHN